jgi:hypothetical protein
MTKPAWWAGFVAGALLLCACSGDASVDASGPPVDSSVPPAEQIEIVVDLDAESVIVINPTDETVSFSPYPEVERRVDGEWSPVSDRSDEEPQPVLPRLQLVQPRSQSLVRVPLLASLESGTYRILVKFGIGNEPPEETVEAEFIVQ